MSDLSDRLRKKFIVIDGPDGSGKTTQLGLLAEYLEDSGCVIEPLVDPGTTAIGQQIRRILLDRDNGGMGSMCETLLFMASRAQLVEERIRPALENGKVVLCDRFTSATIAYQGASGVTLDLIIRLGEIATGGLWPDLTVVLDVPEEVGRKRLAVVRQRLKKDSKPLMKQRSLFGDRLEVKTYEYHSEVRRIFKSLGKVYPAPVCSLDASGNVDEVQQRLRDAITNWQWQP